jgi:hypothetical protein
MIPSIQKYKKKSPNQETPLGFEEESKIKQLISGFKRKFKRLNKEAKYSGVYNNFWLWNTIFLNLAIAIILWAVIRTSYDALPQNIGVNIDNIRRYETVIDKSYIFSIVIVHVVFAFLFFAFGLKAQKRLNHLIIAAFFNFLVLGVFEFIGLRGYISYFL